MPRRALVLGGGGPVGIAWESGLLSGLAEAGVDAAQAELIVGTSAGSVVGAHLALGRPAAKLADAFLSDQQPASASELLTGPPPDLSPLVIKLQDLYSGRRPAELVRREIGAWALQAKTMSEEEFVASFGRTLQNASNGAWPERGYVCTAVDTADGSLMAWNKDSGVELVRAVASSCSVPGIFPPVTLCAHRYMDGGMRSATNADLAKGYDIVVVVAVRPRISIPALAEVFRRPLENELQVLRDGGASVELITPDEPSMDAFGENLMDYRRRPASARAGVNQGRTEANKIRAVWGGA